MLATHSLVRLVADNWAVVTIAIGCCWVVCNYFRRSLHHIPGPFLRRISSLPRILSVYNGFSHDDDIALHNTYGKMVRLAPNTLSISDPKEISTLYGVGTKFSKSPFYSLAEAYDSDGMLPDPFVLTDRAIHARMKRSAANAYSLNNVVQMEPCVDAVTERLVRKLGGYADAEADDARVVDLAPLMQAYAMDAVFALTFGKDCNHMDKGDHEGFFKAIKVANDYMAIFGQVAWCHRFLLRNSWVAAFVPGLESMQKLMHFATDETNAGKGADADQGTVTTFLQRLLANQRQNPKGLTDRELSTHVFNNMAAGSDTTAIALRSIIFNTLMTPGAHEKLKAELRNNLDATRPVSFAATNKLPYLAAVIKEGIRLHPSVGMMLARIVPEGGATLCGQYVPAGVEVGINPWVVQRDAEVYEEPARFNPDRWLAENTTEEQLRLMNQAWIPFGHGAHTCSGRWISTMEIQKVVAQLFLAFDMELADGGKGYRFHNLWFTPQEGLNVHFTRAQ